MTTKVIVSHDELCRAAKLLAAAVSLQNNEHEQRANVIALICDASAETLELKTLHQELIACAVIDIYDEDIEDDLWLELDAVFFSTLLEKTKRASHIEIDIDGRMMSMSISSGKLLEGDLLSPPQFIRVDDSATFNQNIRLIDSLADYDFRPCMDEEAFTTSVSKASCKLLRAVDEFNMAQNATVADHVSVMFSKDKAFVDSTNFHASFERIESEEEECAVLNAASFKAFQKVINLMHISRDAKLLMQLADQQIMLETEKSFASITTKDISHRPQSISLPQKSEPAICLNVFESVEALKKLDAKQKKSEDFVFISPVFREEIPEILFESEPEAGQLTSRVEHIGDLSSFDEIKTLRQPLLAAIKMFLDEESVYIQGVESDSTEIIVSDKLHNKYAAIQKLPHRASEAA
ncbi:hypothetical protein [Marinobacter sp.]|uniref:hypothetical protein n=1 Tax=Marinobacter sp. TaxID=50741 RepID=UPI002627EA01|nr:hypothetical protein [Marinobacter sp.]